MQIREILVPTDFSVPRAPRRWATPLAFRRAGWAPVLTLLHVYQIPSLMLPDGSTFVAAAGGGW